MTTEPCRRVENLTPSLKGPAWRRVLTALLLCGCISAFCPARGADLSPAATVEAAPGAEAVVPVFLSGARQVTVGSFRVTLEVPPSGPSPKLLSMEAGSDLSERARGCEACRSLTAYPFLPHIEGEAAASGLFVLPSGEPLGEADGLNGDELEVVRVHVSVPSDALTGARYGVTLSDLSLSDASSSSVDATAGKGVIVIVPPVELMPGTTTAYTDSVKAGLLLAPTSGDDPSTPVAEPGFPNDGRSVGNRRYAFRVEATGLGNTALQWSMTAANMDGAPVPQALAGTLEAGNADGTLGWYTPTDAAMRSGSGVRLTLTAHSVRNPARSVSFDALLLPYGDANLDGRVTKEDADLAFRWANGLDLPLGTGPAESLNLWGFVPSPLRRLLTDVRGVPGEKPGGFNLWTEELQRLDLTLPGEGEFDRTDFPFGDGRITLADVAWIARKAALNAAQPSLTLDPRVFGTSPQNF